MSPRSPGKPIPSHVAMAWPTLCAIKRAGGTATNDEIMDAVAAELRLTDEQRALLCGRGSRTLLDYRLAWARTFLRNMGAIANDAPRHWSVTPAGMDVTAEDIQLFARKYLDRLAEYNRRKQQQASRELAG